MARPPLGSEESLGRRLRRRLAQDWGLILLSLGLSVVLWIFITNEQNPPRTDLFPQPIPVRPVNVPPGLDLSADVEPVALRIVAPRDLWGSLTTRDFRAVVDLAGAEAGERAASVLAEAADPRVRIVDVRPATVNVRLEELAEAVVPVKVKLQGEVPLGYLMESFKTTPAEVRVRGPASLVSLVVAAQAEVGLTDLRADLSRTLELSLRNLRGYEVKGVVMEPTSARLEITVRRVLQFSSLVVVPKLTGQVAAGYQLVSLAVEPALVTLAGPPEILEKMANVETAPLDLGGAKEDLERSLPLALPPGVTAVGVPRVTVRISVQLIKAG